MDPLRTLSLAMSSPALEREYRRINDALQRTPGELPAFDPARWSASALTSARSAWIERMSAEHRSFPVFSALASQLSEAGATFEAEAVMLRMATDEIRHAELCGVVVSALGDEPACAAVREVPPLARHAGCSPEERALRNVIFGSCLSEVVNCARFVALLDATEDPYLRDVTRQLLADEAAHGQLGYHYLEAWRPWLDARPDVRASLARYLRYAFAVYEAEHGGSDGPFPARSPDELRAGIPDLAVSRDVLRQTVAHAVVPGLARFGIDAETAWRTRSLDAAP